MDYTNILQNLFNSLASNPIVQGLVIAAIKEALPIVLKDVDDSGIEKKVEGWLSPTLIAVTALVAVGNLFVQGQLHTMDPNAVVLWLQTFIQTYIGAKAAGTETVQKAVTKVVGK